MPPANFKYGGRAFFVNYLTVFFFREQTRIFEFFSTIRIALSGRATGT
jgi:hypothetical protein